MKKNARGACSLPALEILAPVGGEEQLIAAVRSGADAVYLGAKGFNARRNAENFDDDGLQRAIAYCHGRGVAVYVTMNTLVTDGEIARAQAQIRSIARCGADAVIVQDLAVAKLWRDICPSMPLHASTQMTVHDVAGVQAAQQLGFSRVVLARELTLDEIRQIVEHSEIEIEVFIHGALCMSVSGCCYLSAMLGERSGNRGLCAQPCRLDFRQNGREYALSLKDMCHIPYLAQLEQIGVRSVKIEGRMKRPEYVSAAIDACRLSREGKTPDLAGLQAIFSRSGFTDGYLTGKRTLQMFGYRKKEDVLAGKDALAPQRAHYRTELQNVPVTLHFSVPSAGSASLTASDGVHAATAAGAAPDVAREHPLTEEIAARSLTKTGGTPFRVATLHSDIADGVTLPAAALNALRREALERLLQQREKLEEKPCMPAAFAAPQAYRPIHPPIYRLRFSSGAQCFDDGVSELQLPLRELETHPALIDRVGARLIAELPALCFPQQEETLFTRLQRLRAMGIIHVSADNLGLIRLAQTAGMTVHGGYGLNILNTLSLTEYERMGLADATVSFEISARDIAALGGEKPRGALVYGYLPLMQYRACPARGKDGCGDCQGTPTLSDRRGTVFSLQCNDRQYATLLNSVPLYLADKALPRLDFYTLYFTQEDRETCRNLLLRYQRELPPETPRTNGLYFRELK